MTHRIPLGAVAFLCLGVAPTAAAAQDAAGQPPPKVLQIFIESVKPGKSAAHEKIEVGWPAAFSKAKWPTNYIGMTSMSGQQDAWFVAGYPSWAALETDNENVGKNKILSRELERLGALDGELLTGTRGIYAVYHPEMSYRPDIDVGRMRYVAFTTMSLKPGYDSAFADTRKLVLDAHVKANLDEHYAVYEVATGLPGPTYLIVFPMRSLQEVDAFAENHDGKTYRDALGETGRQRLRQFAREGMVSSETRLFAFSPKMSYPAEAWVASDPEFWRPKVATASKP
ncbi:MAG TPA: hypothetical protein VH764_08495 [Gemmatimonadales bacterium]